MDNKTLRQLTKIVQQRRLSRQQQSDSGRMIYQHMLANSRCVNEGNFAEICSADLGMLFQISDEHFFDGHVGRLCEQVADRPLSFRLSTRMTNAGGMTTMLRSKQRSNPSVEFEIAIATTPLFMTFSNQQTTVVGGLKCRDRLEALQRIMEHEMVHLIEMLIWGDSSCAAKPFKSIVSRFFGHTESNHQMLTPRDLARKRLGISPGDRVAFVVDGCQLVGHVNRITKRATVLVHSDRGTLYSDGKKYSKYYVPLNRLRRA